MTIAVSGTVTAIEIPIGCPVATSSAMMTTSGMSQSGAATIA